MKQTLESLTMRFVAVALAIGPLLDAPAAHAVSEGAPAIYQPLLITSARAAGMGGLTVTLEESGISAWRNPGMLAFDDRFRFTGTETQLVPDLADDIWLRSALASAPLALPIPLTVAMGYSRLSFGDALSFDDDGGGSDAFDESINLTVATAVRSTIGLGVTFEHVHSRLVDPIPELDIIDGDADARGVSLGAGVRREFVIDVAAEDSGRVVVTPVAAISLLHWGQDIEYNDEDLPEPMARHLHLGLGLRIAHEPARSSRIFDAARLSQFAFTAGIERSTPQVDERLTDNDGPRDPPEDDAIKHYGVEIAVAGLMSARYGSIDDPDGEITNNTWGLGFGVENVFPFDARIDYASFPQADGLDRVDRWDLVVSLNPGIMAP